MLLTFILSVLIFGYGGYCIFKTIKNASKGQCGSCSGCSDQKNKTCDTNNKK